MPSHTDKKSAKELRDELRGLRKESVRPVSRMKVQDISVEIERLRNMRETTPAVASVPSAPLRKMKSAVSSIKEAKAREFPVMPEAEAKKGGAAPKMKAKKAQVAPEPEPKKKSQKDKLKEMLKFLEESEDSE